MKNWKSTLAFFIFVTLYVYTVFLDKEPSVIDVAGHIALYSSIFMMFRSDITTDIISKLFDNIKLGK